MIGLKQPEHPADGGDPAADAAEMLFVEAGRRHFAVPAAAVLHICALGEVTRLPGQPPEILGLANLRGRIGVVICLASLLGLEPARAGPRRFLVSLGGGCGCALAVESAGDVRRPAPLERASAPAPRRPARPRVFSGWLDTEFGLVEILDPAALCDFDTSGSAAA